MSELYGYTSDGVFRVRLKVFKNSWGLYNEFGANVHGQQKVNRKWQDSGALELNLKVSMYGHQQDLNRWTDDVFPIPAPLLTRHFYNGLEFKGERVWPHGDRGIQRCSA
jgi:hypothetical protein